MAYETGTADSSTHLLQKLNTFLTANGWTNIRGETDIVPASPKAARYWRILFLEVDSTTHDYRGVSKLEWRGTPGGANLATDGNAYYFRNLGSGSGANIVSGTGETYSTDVNDELWWVAYDFGSATSIEEVEITCGTDDSAPAHFMIQWSHDNFTWTTMFKQDYDSSLWTGNYQTQTFTFASGHVDATHASSTVARRTGWSWYTGGSSSLARSSGMQSDDIWCWQGPGYDAARRVYVSAMAGFDLTTNDEMITWDMCTELDTQLTGAQWLIEQEGSTGNTTTNKPTHYMTTLGVTYWFFCNSTRFIIVTRSGVDDYSSSYLGFLSAFAQPDDYPFPLFMSSSYTHYNGGSLSDDTSGMRDMHDPSSGSAWVRDWDNVWNPVQNHDVISGAIEDWTASPEAWTWPLHVGSAGRNDWPLTATADYAGNPVGHWLDRVDPTEQGDLPTWPLLVQHQTYGNLGAMTGVYKLPAGGVLAPEATFTIGGDTFHVFATRDYSGGHNYYAIKED